MSETVAFNRECEAKMQMGRRLKSFAETMKWQEGVISHQKFKLTGLAQAQDKQANIRKTDRTQLRA